MTTGVSKWVRFVLIGALFVASGSYGGAAAGSAFFYTEDVKGGWHNGSDPASSEARIDPGGRVTWENRDTTLGHPVECLSKSNNACPWQGIKELPAGSTGCKDLQSCPRVTIQFPESGTYYFHCSAHQTMTGKVIVGDGNPPPPSGKSSLPPSRESPTSKPKSPVVEGEELFRSPGPSTQQGSPSPDQQTQLEGSPESEQLGQPEPGEGGGLSALVVVAVIGACGVGVFLGIRLIRARRS